MNREAQFIDFLTPHQGILHKVARTYCHDPEGQKDLMQEISLQLWRSYHRYDASYKTSTWIYRIALNIAISQFRKEQTRTALGLPLNEALHQVAEEDEIHQQEENIKVLLQLIDELNALNKAVMILYLDDKSHEEIADILGISKSNVGTKINRIKQRLKMKFSQLKLTD